MQLKIENETVRRNIEIFKVILKRSAQKKQEGKSCVYKAFIHRVRGEIRFSEMDPADLQEKEWQPIAFSFSLPHDTHSCFDCKVDLEEQLVLDSQAMGVLKETIKTMQFIARFLPKINHLPAVLLEFSQLNLDSFLDHLATKDIIHEAWHQMDRVGCEKVLLSHPPGTFLFRKDVYAAILEEQLQDALSQEIKCITLSYVDTLKRVRDLTLVRRAEGWLFYNDDPSLLAPLYPSAGLLLESLKGVLKIPVLHEE